MSEIDDYKPTLICVGLLGASLERAKAAVRRQLENAISKHSVSCELMPVCWADFFEQDGLFYDIKRFQIALFSARAEQTVYVCNLADGWISLFGNLVRLNALDAYFFRSTLSRSVEFEAFEMIHWKSGSQSRQLRALQDESGWNFLDQGDPLPFESPMQYKKRQIGSRLDCRLLEAYSAAAGFELTSVPRFRGECWIFRRQD